MIGNGRGETAHDQRLGLFIAVLAGVYLVSTAWNLNLQTVASPDEPRYAAAAREMLRSGDWIVPQFNAQPRLVKPILFYWELAGLGAAGKAIGLSDATAYRLGPLLMGLLTVLATFLLGSRLRSPRFGFVAAVILLTAFEFHKLARELVVDMTLTAFLLWAWFFFHVSVRRIESQAPAFFPLLGFYLCLGLACMTKGPFLVGIFVVVPLLAYLWWTGRLKVLLKAGVYWGAPLSLALGLWWSAALAARGYDAVSFFSVENVNRFIGAKDHTQNPVPFVFYLGTLAGNFAPWILLLPVAAWWSYTALQTARRAGEPLSDSAKFALCCLAIPFFIMGISLSKRPLYILPIYPFLALWAAWPVDAAYLAQEGQNFCARCANVLGAGVAALFVGLAVAAHWLPSFAPKLQAQPQELLLLSAILVGLAFAGWSASQNLKIGRRYNALLQILAMAIALIIGYESIVLPIRERDADRVRFFTAVRQRIQDRAFAMFEDSPNEAVWYLDRPHERIEELRRPELKADYFDKPGALMLALKQDGARQKIEPQLLSALRVLDTIPRGARVYILAEPNPDHPPDPSIFVKKGQDQADIGDE